MRLASWFLMGRHASDALCAAFEKAISLVSEQVLRERMHAVLSVDVSEKLKRLHLPILYLRGIEDRVVPRFAAELICDLAPHTHLVDLAGPHCLLQAVPVEAAVVVGRFSREAGANQRLQA